VLLFTSALSFNTSSSLINLRTYHYFSFFKLSRKKFERGFFNLSSLRKFTAKKPAPLSYAEAHSFFNSVGLKQLPSLLYKLSPHRRYFVSFFFTTHLQKESLALASYFTSSLSSASSFAFKGASVFN
jgi:hypothetical protein